MNPGLSQSQVQLNDSGQGIRRQPEEVAQVSGICKLQHMLKAEEVVGDHTIHVENVWMSKAHQDIGFGKKAFRRVLASVQGQTTKVGSFYSHNNTLPFGLVD